MQRNDPMSSSNWHGHQLKHVLIYHIYKCGSNVQVQCPLSDSNLTGTVHITELNALIQFSHGMNYFPYGGEDNLRGFD